MRIWLFFFLFCCLSLLLTLCETSAAPYNAYHRIALYLQTIHICVYNAQPHILRTSLDCNVTFTLRMSLANEMCISMECIQLFQCGKIFNLKDKNYERNFIEFYFFYYWKIQIIILKTSPHWAFIQLFWVWTVNRVCHPLRNTNYGVVGFVF